jgi:long-subunit acyl-CoA synthetase (AMP-forming)
MTGTMTIPDGVLPNTKFVPGSVGIIWPSTEAKILRADGSSAELNEPGELYVRGRHIALGYWKNEKASRETFVDGWLRTGDLFKVDQWGNFLYVTRLHRCAPVLTADFSASWIGTRISLR